MNRDTMRLSAAAGEGAGAAPGAQDQIEMLISRLADGEGAPSDWAAFGTLAQRVPDAWEQLARAQRDHAALSVAVGVALHAAERVELPTREAAERFAHVGADGAGVHRIEVWSRVRSWGGWAAAAAIVLMWAAVSPRPVQVSTPPNTAGLTIPANFHKVETPEDAVSLYKKMGTEAGNVLAEVPQRTIIDQRPTADGKGLETVYLRQFIEKTIVYDLQAFKAMDEAGKPILVPVKPAASPEAPQ